MTLVAPAVGVGAVIVHEGRVALIQRGKEPLRGRWLIPGGTLELGETLEDAVAREVKEETGLTVRPREVVLVFDRIHRDETGVVYHYVIIDYRCEYVGGTLSAATDAADAAWVAADELAAYDIPEEALRLVQKALSAAAAEKSLAVPAGPL